jgi:hypothetical protein
MIIRKGKHYFIESICEICKNEFHARKDAVKRGIGRYCSRSCQGKSYWQKGHKPWNKNLKGTHFSPNTEFKPRKWKFNGTRIEYINLHNEIRKMLGTPDTCEHCNVNKLTGRQIHWANKSGKYLLDRSDWLRLCAKCHYKYDKVDYKNERNMAER